MESIRRISLIRWNERMPMFWLALISGIGIFCARFWPVVPWVPFLLFLLVGVLGGILFRDKMGGISIWALAGLAFYFYGVVRLHGVSSQHFMYAMQEDRGETMVLKMRVVDDPRVRGSLGKARRIECLAEVEEIKSVQGWRRANGRVLVRSYDLEERSIHYGDVWQVTGFLARPTEVVNWGVFDYGTYLQQKGITHVLEVKKDYAQLLDKGKGVFWLKVGYALRRHMLKILQLGVEDDPQITALMAGMLFGYTDGVSEEIEEAFRVTGTLHLFAVSGQNVAVIAGMFLLFLQIVGVITWRWGWVLLPLVFSFCLATGMESSALRAFLMWGLVLIGWRLYRPVNLLNTLATAALIIWLFEPSQLFDLGFQLSFFVSLALILFCAPLLSALRRLWVIDPWIPQRLIPPLRLCLDKVFLVFCGLLASSLCALAASLPFSLWHFHLVSFVSLLANIVIVPLASVVVLVSALAVITSFIWNPLTVLLNQVTWLLLKMILLLNGFLADMPGGHAYIRMGFEESHQADRAQIWVCQGARSAPVIAEVDNQFYLLGPGDASTWKWVVSPLSKKLGVNYWDGLVLTQPGASYCGALDILTDRVETRLLTDGGVLNRSHLYAKWVEIAAKERIAKRFIRKGDIVNIGNKSYMECLWPDTSASGMTPDDQSSVLRLVFSDKVVTFAGGISQTVERKILQDGLNIQSDVLVQGEHISSGNLSSAWLDAVKPKHLIRHSKGFQTDRSLDIEFWQSCEERGIKVWWLPQTGGIQILVCEEDIKVKAYHKKN